ncbi:hypothetical protein C0J50_20716 [Silurus asotus]|uniref:Uncharacterized protein n=1 Tax=Silurus asotus TaxID=30991 RepID=A0AAD5AMW7_SILAS|nr:hypothetical protein C0J50_20716 [Silurus asotus]
MDPQLQEELQHDQGTSTATEEELVEECEKATKTVEEQRNGNEGKEKPKKRDSIIDILSPLEWIQTRRNSTSRETPELQFTEGTDKEVLLEERIKILLMEKEKLEKSHEEEVQKIRLEFESERKNIDSLKKREIRELQQKQKQDLKRKNKEETLEIRRASQAEKEMLVIQMEKYRNEAESLAKQLELMKKSKDKLETELREKLSVKLLEIEEKNRMMKSMEKEIQKLKLTTREPQDGAEGAKSTDTNPSFNKSV